MSNADREKRRTFLRGQEEMLHELYMAAPANSKAERDYERQLEAVMNELDAIFREIEAEWGANDDRILRQQIADGRPS